MQFQDVNGLRMVLKQGKKKKGEANYKNLLKQRASLEGNLALQLVSVHSLGKILTWKRGNDNEFENPKMKYLLSEVG